MAGPPAAHTAHRGRPLLRADRWRVPGCAGRDLLEADRTNPLTETCTEHVPLVRRQYIFRTREQGQAEPGAPGRLAGPAEQRAPDRDPDRERLGDEGRPEGPDR